MIRTDRKLVKVAEMATRSILSVSQVPIIWPVIAQVVVVTTIMIAACFAIIHSDTRDIAFGIVLRLNSGSIYADSSLAKEAVELGFRSGYNSNYNQHWVRS